MYGVTTLQLHVLTLHQTCYNVTWHMLQCYIKHVTMLHGTCYICSILQNTVIYVTKLLLSMFLLVLRKTQLLYRVTYKEFDFRDDFPELKLSVSS